MKVTITPTEAAGLETYEARGVVQLEIKDLERILSASRPAVQRLLDNREIPSFKVGPITKIPIAGFKKYLTKALAGN